MSEKRIQQAIKALDVLQIALVYPLKNRKDIPSLWSAFYPRSEMVWEWTEDSDDRVALLWQLRRELSETGKVAYLKWFQGRATFTTLKSFTYMLAYFESAKYRKQLSPDAKRILDFLEESSPHSTKRIKRECELAGKIFEARYARALKELFELGFVVGWGEVDEGAFPSLAVGATQLLFEKEWKEAQSIPAAKAGAKLQDLWNKSSVFFKFALKVKAKRIGQFRANYAGVGIPANQ